ncbi:MAG: hypothetical protein ACK413_00175 [Patescibacteria group bacterium]
MKNSLFILIIFVIFFFLYYLIQIPPLLNIDDIKLFLTISTFIFAIFAGFFISKQSLRYSQIRDTISKFDGNMSFIYRCFQHFDQAQIEVGKILKAHYQPILKEKKWYYPFTRKTTTLTSIHNLIEKISQEKSLSDLHKAVLARIMASLQEAQRLRKEMIALYQERYPKLQWVPIYLFTLIIFINLSFVQSYQSFLTSLFKSIFITGIFFVIILLYKLDQLEFFEGMVGENSARDVLEIIEGKK